MDLWQQYESPSTVQEALTLLERAGGRVIAGGTDLLLDMQQGRQKPVETLVDICGIPEMTDIRLADDHVYLGGAVTHRQILDNAILADQAACLVQASGVIGGPQVRNVATIGGNVAHGLPAADGTIALLALGAEAEIAGQDGRRWQPLDQIFVSPGETTFDRARQILVQFRFPAAGRREGSAFSRVMRPQGVAIAILNMAAWLRLDPQGKVEHARLAIGPAGPTPWRARQAEARLIGRPVERASLAELQKDILAEAAFRESRHRATRRYRQHLVRTLVERTVPLAAERADG